MTERRNGRFFFALFYRIPQPWGNYLAVKVVENGPILSATEYSQKNIQCMTDGDMRRDYRTSAIFTRGTPCQRQ